MLQQLHFLYYTHNHDRTFGKCCRLVETRSQRSNTQSNWMHALLFVVSAFTVEPLRNSLSLLLVSSSRLSLPLLSWLILFVLSIEWHSAIDLLTMRSRSALEAIDFPSCDVTVLLAPSDREIIYSFHIAVNATIEDFWLNITANGLQWCLLSPEFEWLLFANG